MTGGDGIVEDAETDGCLVFSREDELPISDENENTTEPMLACLPSTTTRLPI